MPGSLGADVRPGMPEDESALKHIPDYQPNGFSVQLPGLNYSGAVHTKSPLGSETIQSRLEPDKRNRGKSHS